ncbi:zinc ribbon domain-containing protein [Anaerotignum sp.]|uniref:zinc ribbon domain-containing protein n=1 Tax=Anaerotignum sp. TaxID=2039241 RepID=UPI0027146B84|nr:zinc ribbon domain-containing protein [Anaerotignum sp.]
MDFFDKLGEAARNLTEKAGDSLEINRLTGEISIEKGNVQYYHKELGEHYWAKFAVGEKLDDEAMLICDKVVVSQDRIRHLEIEIEKIKKEREAIQEERAKTKRPHQEEEEKETEQPKVEEPQDKDAEVLVEAVAEQTEEWPRYCHNCGGAIKEGQRFCIFCGAEVK